MSQSPVLESTLARALDRLEVAETRNQQLEGMLRTIRKNFWLDDEGTDARNRTQGEMSAAVDAVLAGTHTWQECPTCQILSPARLVANSMNCKTCDERGGFLVPVPIAN